MIKHFATAIVVAFVFLGTNTYSQSNTLYHEMHYYSHEQNMWGPDSAYGIDINHTFFDIEIDESYGFSEITEFFGQQFGVGFQGGIYALLASTFEAYGFYTGSFDLDYPIQTIMEFPEHDSFDYGGPATIHTSYIVTDGWALDTEFPPVGVITLDFEYQFNPFMDIIVCVFSCDTIHLIPPGVQVPHTLDTLFHINGYTEYAVYPCYVGDQLQFCNSYELPIDVDLTDLVGFDFVIQVDLPYVETEAYIEEETNCLIAYGNDEYAFTKLDILGFIYVMAGYIPEPEGPAIQEAIDFLDGEFNFPISTPLGEIQIQIDYTLLSVYLNVTNTLVQEISFCPTIWATLSFPTHLEYVINDPLNGYAEVETGFSDTIVVAVGNDLTITYPCHGVEPFLDSMYVGVQYNIQPTIRNHTWDSIAFSIVIEALTFDILIVTPFKSNYSDIEIPEFNLPNDIIALKNNQEVKAPVVNYSNIYKSIDDESDGEEKNIGPWSIGPLFEWTISLGYAPVTWFDQTWELMHFEEDIVFPGTYIKPYDKSEINALLYIQGNSYCYGEPSDFVFAEAQNGLPPFTFEWSTGHFTDWTDNDTDSIWAEPGFYMVTITDTYDCESYDSITVIVNPPILHSLTPIDLLCHGFNQGSVQTTVSGGTPPYFFSWSNGSIAQNPTNLSAGWHTVTITDWVGCSIIDSVFLNQPETPLTIISDVTDIPCHGTDYGSINITLSGATPPYLVQWSSGQTFHNLANLPAGPYTISVTDANNCLWTEIIYVHEPDSLIATVEYVNIPCAGDDSGEIIVNVAGGTPDYTYHWFHDQTQGSNHLADLHPGLYMVSVVDANNCSDTATAIISEPDELLLDFTIKDASCKGVNDAYVIVHPLGGIPDYLIEWSTGHFNDSIGGLQAGNYGVTVIDSNDCYNIQSVYVGEPEYHLTSDFVNIQNVSCFGFSDASADVSPHGGTEPYFVEWEEGVNQEGFAGYDMPANTFFNITVTDVNGCIYFDSIRFTQPAVLQLQGNTTPVICGESAGSGQINPSGGTPPYSYLWSNGENTQNASDLYAGYVFATVTDANNCIDSIVLTVELTGKIFGNYSIIDHNLCYEDSIAAAVVTLPNGFEPKSYIWSNGYIGDTATNLHADTYIVYAYDKYNCGDTIEVVVPHPDSIRANFEFIKPTCSGVYDGRIEAFPTGGTPEYSYLWNDGSTESAIEDVREGNYFLTITDANSCVFEYYFELNEEKYCIFVYNTFTPNGDGVNDTWIVKNIEQFVHSKVWIYNRVGNLVYHETNYQNDWDGTFNGQELPEATYYYIIDLGVGRDPIKGHVTIIR